jgi:uncharacterized protein (DUF1697 family)
VLVEGKFARLVSAIDVLTARRQGRNSGETGVADARGPGRAGFCYPARLHMSQPAAAHVALLRAVNLPGHGKIAMADLRTLMDGLKLQDSKTLLQSGNMVFRSATRTGAALEELLARETSKRFGVTTAFFVRTADEWDEIVARNPFPGEAKSDPSHLVLLCLTKAVTALQTVIVGREVVRGHGREVYASYPDGIGESRLTSALIEKKLGTRATGRNWNTVLKIQSSARALSATPDR